jgi:hypothetical protein
MKRPNLDSLTQEQSDYVTYLEGALFGSNDLTNELQLMKQQIAKELGAIRETGAVLADDKMFVKIVTLMGEDNKSKTISARVEKIKPKTKDKEEPTEGFSDTNIFEQVSKKLKESGTLNGRK